MFLLPNLSPKQEILRVLLVWQGNFCASWKDKNREKPLALDAMSLTSHGRCGRLKILRASSGIFSRLQHPPVGFCIQHKAINKIKPFLRDKNESLKSKSSVQFVVAQVIRSIPGRYSPKKNWFLNTDWTDLTDLFMPHCSLELLHPWSLKSSA